MAASALSRAAFPAGRGGCRLGALSKLGLNEALSTPVELSSTPLSSVKLIHAVHFAGADAGAELAMGIDAVSSGVDGSDRCTERALSQTASNQGPIDSAGMHRVDGWRWGARVSARMDGTERV